MNNYKKALALINTYLQKEQNAEDSDIFCNQYMDLFFEYSDEFEKNITHKTFEILDNINLICDSYEKNPEMRKEDNYCIDEHELQRKIKNQMKNL